MAVGCGLGDASLTDVDPDAIPATVSYEADVGPRIDYYCVSCHHADGQQGNAGGWDFSSYELVKASFGSIELTAIQDKSMPPGGARRLTARDAAILLRWRDQGFAR